LKSIVKVTFVFTSLLGLNLLFGNLRLLVSNVVSYKYIYNEGFYFCLIVLCVFKHFPYLLVLVFPFCPFLFLFLWGRDNNFIRKHEGQTDPLFKEALQQMYGED
jgi:hypothetical protein